MMSDLPRLSFVGTATMTQDEQTFEVDVTLYAEGASPASSFFGHYTDATPPGLKGGSVRIRFSDGSEADALLASSDPETGGIRIYGHLESAEEVRGRAAGTKSGTT